MDWFRSHHGAPSDTKLKLISIKSKQPRAIVTAIWWEILDHASRNVTRGYVAACDFEIIACQQEVDTQVVASIVSAMEDRGMIIGGYLSSWDKRQPKREDPDASERKRRQRARDHVTPSHAPSRPVTTDKRKEDKRKEEEAEAKAPASSAKRGAAAADVVTWIMKRLNATTPYTFSAADQWLTNGADFELDIKPVVERFAASARPPPRSLALFTEDIATSVRQRNSPMPAASKGGTDAKPTSRHTDFDKRDYSPPPGHGFSLD